MRVMRGLAVPLVLVAVVLGGARVDAASPPDDRVEMGLLEATEPQQVVVRFTERIPDGLDHDGLSVTYRFQSVPAVVATVTPEAARALASRDDLAYLEVPKPIAFDLDSATVASRAVEVWDPPVGDPVLDDEGDVVDGSGIGIAIVDSGIDAFHPDLDDPGKVAGNWMVTPAGLVEARYSSDLRTAHGTHVAGIAAGTGELSGGLWRGAAPGASLYGFGVTANGSTVSAAIALDWIAANGHIQSPPIRVVNNSWNCGSSVCQTFNADQIHIVAASAVANAGITVTWSAGNEGGDGVYASINPEAINPTPGIVGVANYKDEGWPDLPVGTRAGCLSESSSWGDSSDASTWPDVAAPGRSVISTWAMGPFFNHSLTDREVQLTGRNPVDNSGAYRSLSGTSMAAPHTAGIVAMMLQVEPDLTPAEVEYILKQIAEPLIGTAEKAGCGVPGTNPPQTIPYIAADPAHPWTPSNYAAGHGLIDAVAAVATADGFAGIPTDRPEPVAPADVPGFVVVEPAVTFTEELYLSGASDLSRTQPEGLLPRVTPLPPDATASFTSEPFAQDLTFEAARVSISMGTTAECPCIRLTPPFIRARVERVGPGGEVEELGASLGEMWFVVTAGPVPRALDITMPAPVTIATGERIRMTIEWGTPAYQVLDPGPYGAVLYTEGFTAARLSLGDIVEDPTGGSRAECDKVEWCADIGGDRSWEGLTCGAVPVRLTWRGPPGSALRFSCFGIEFTCEIVGEPGQTEDGECERVIEVPHIRAYKGGACGYVMASGARGGSGRCDHLLPIETDT